LIIVCNPAALTARKSLLLTVASAATCLPGDRKSHFTPPPRHRTRNRVSSQKPGFSLPSTLVPRNNDNYALIGSKNDDNENGYSSGSAYLFDITSGDFKQKIVAPDGAPYDDFGESVALDEDLALIGSWEDSDNGYRSGSAHVFPIA